MRACTDNPWYPRATTISGSQQRCGSGLDNIGQLMAIVSKDFSNTSKGVKEDLPILCTYLLMMSCLHKNSSFHFISSSMHVESDQFLVDMGDKNVLSRLWRNISSKPVNLKAQNYDCLETALSRKKHSLKQHGFEGKKVATW